MAERKSKEEIEQICKKFIESRKTIGEFCRDTELNVSSVCSWMEARGYRMIKKSEMTKYRRMYVDLVMQYEPETLDWLMTTN